MKRWLFYLTASLLIVIGTGTFIYAQNSNNQNTSNQYVSQPGYPYSYNINQNTSGNSRTGNQYQNQPPYRSTSGSNPNIGTSGLSSFMRDSASADNLSKYLINNNQGVFGNNYRSNLTGSQTMMSQPQNTIGTSPYAQVTYNSGIPFGTNSQTTSGSQAFSGNFDSVNTSAQRGQYNSQLEEMQKQLNNLYLQAGSQNSSNSEEITRRLANISQQLNTLQQKLGKDNNNTNAALSNNMQQYMNSSGGNKVTSTSEYYSGIDDNPSRSYLNSNTNLNQYQSGINSSSARMETSLYQSNNFTNTIPRQSSNDSLDQIKQKLDDLSRSIDTEIQKPQNSTMRYGPSNNSSCIQGQSTNFQSYSKTQFNNYFNTAQEQLKTGNYYSAADSFMLASVYEPENPLCCAGQGHAMFAAGQYINSALYIIRAIELNPDYIQVDVDFISIAGGRDMVASRISELEGLLKKAPAAGLQFLLGYVYYRTGRLPEARQIINALYQEIPQSRAALALKITIDTKLGNSN